jgi:hypothetical protein
MLAPVSVGLKFGFLIVLYLFLLWVAWSAMRDLRRGRGGVVRADNAAPYDATGMYPASSGLGDHDGDETSRSGSTIRSPPPIMPASRGKATSS